MERPVDDTRNRARTRAPSAAPFVPGARREDSPVWDLAATVTCAVVWGTSWYAITLQFGVVDPITSLAYRFGLAALLLFAWCRVRGEAVALTRAQQTAAAGVGLCSFTIDYGLTYLAETHLVSAIVAVVFAALAFVNLVVFRVVVGARGPRVAWAAAGLGFLGVALLSATEIAGAAANAQVWRGLIMAFAAVLAAACGNLFARRGEQAGAPLQGSLAWAMAYGAVLLAAFATMTGRPWTFDVRPGYVASLVYLAVAASVIAFLLYFGLARRRGYTTAAYILSLTPVLAVAMSTWFEGKTWSRWGVIGIGLVLAGQGLLLRATDRSS